MKTEGMTETRAILANYHALTERQYVGDVGVFVALLDFATAVERAELTDRQSEALRLVYGEGMTQGIKQHTEWGEMMNDNITKIKRNPFLDLLLNESATPDGRNEEAHIYVNKRDGYINEETATDLALWILYGSRDVTVATQIRLARYKEEMGNCV